MSDPLAAKRAELTKRIRASQAARLRAAGGMFGSPADLQSALERINPSLERDIARMPEAQLDALGAFYAPNRRQYVY